MGTSPAATVLEHDMPKHEPAARSTENEVLGSKAFKDQEHIIAQAQAAHEQQAREMGHVSDKGVDVLIPPVQVILPSLS